MALGDISTENLQKAGGIIASRNYHNTQIGSFKVAKDPVSNTWYAVLNQTHYLGKDLPSQADALALLHAVMIQKGGNEAGVNAKVAQMIARGTGEIEASEILTSWGPVGSITLGSVFGGFTANQGNGDSLFEDIGLVQINVIAGPPAYITFFFFTPNARDAFKTFTKFALGETGQEATVIEPSNLSWIEQNVTATSGFGLQFNDTGAEAAWIAAMTPGSVSGYFAGTYAGMRSAQTLTWTMTSATGNATFSDSTGRSIIDVNRTNLLKVSDHPRLWNGDDALNFGASLSSGRYRFPALSGGHSLSDNQQSENYWNRFAIKWEKNGTKATMSSFPLDSAGSAQPAYFNWSSGSSPPDGVDGIGNVFKWYVIDGTPENNRRITFTTGGSPAGTSVAHISVDGSDTFKGNNYTSSISFPTIKDIRFQLSSEQNRDGLLEWLNQNGNATLQSIDGTTHVSNLTHTSHTSGTDYFVDFSVVTGNILADTSYEIRWT